MEWLRRLLGWRPLRRRRWRIVSRVEAADLVPEQLPARGVVLVETAGQPAWLAFDCPCDKGERILLNVSPMRNPYWTVLKKDPLRLRPSIDIKQPKHRCHFWIWNGKVRWAYEEDCLEFRSTWKPTAGGRSDKSIADADQDADVPGDARRQVP